MLKKERTYKLTKEGYEKMMADIKKDKVNKASNILSVIIVLAFFSLGFLSKEYLLLYGVGKVSKFLVSIFS